MPARARSISRVGVDLGRVEDRHAGVHGLGEGQGQLSPTEDGTIDPIPVSHGRDDLDQTLAAVVMDVADEQLAHVDRVDDLLLVHRRRHDGQADLLEPVDVESRLHHEPRPDEPQAPVAPGDGRVARGLDDMDHRHRWRRVDLVEGQVRRIRGDQGPSAAGRRELAQRRAERPSRDGVFALAEEPDDPAGFDAVDDHPRIAAVRAATAPRRDDRAVVVDRRFGPDPTDDPEDPVVRHPRHSPRSPRASVPSSRRDRSGAAAGRSGMRDGSPPLAVSPPGIGDRRPAAGTRA